MNIDIEELFNTKDKSELLLANFKNLKASAGWQVVVQMVDANIKALEDQILNGFGDSNIVETKELIDRKRDKLKAYREVIEIPDNWIKKLESPMQVVENDDPYDNVDSMKKHRKDN